MTLCLAWKRNGKVEFASDSRLTFKSGGNPNYVDVGIKVFSIPVKIYSATSAQTGRTSLDFDTSIGLCFAGYTTNAYIVKETIQDILQNLQYSPYTDFSMYGICNLVLKFYEHTSTKLCELMREDGIAEFFLAGYCPDRQKLRTFKFQLNILQHPIKAVFKEILVDDGIEFLGSGSSQASNILKMNPSISPFKLLKKIIEDKTVSDVGGNIQYGTFYPKNSVLNFEISGVEEYSISNGELSMDLKLRGTQLYRNDIVLSDQDFVISYSFIRPFQNEIDDYLKGVSQTWD